jgi:thiosulfate/3-mercaptopyruvate sulfurtransferase
MLVTPSRLAERMDDPSVAIVDLRWREDGSGRARYVAGHIPGAVYLDWSVDLVDHGHRFAFMLAPPERLAHVLGAAGIGDGSTVVAYADDHGSGPHRLWWASRVHGHQDVVVLDGGFDRWQAEHLPVESGVALRPRAVWTPGRAVGGGVATAEDVAAAADDPDAIVLDSRPADQFRGEAVWFETGPIPAGPDGVARTPRGELRAGRVPWAKNVPAEDLYHRDFTLKSPRELRQLFDAKGVTERSSAITYCGVGISASALAFALTVAGVRDVLVYDASWDEWGRDPARPVVRDRATPGAS